MPGTGRLSAHLTVQLEEHAEVVAHRLGPVVRSAALRLERPGSDDGGHAAPCDGLSQGRPLSDEFRTRLEPTIGWSLAAVRIHTDRVAAAVAAALGTPAFALGNHIGFAAGCYDPTSPWGAHVLAHELTHVRQQAALGVVTLQRYEAGVHEAIERDALSRVGKLSQQEISAVYFGNWMRDYNQVFVPLVFDTAPLEADDVYLLICYLALRKFGREPTPEQFGYYIPAEHMDSPGGLVKALDLLPRQPKVGDGSIAGSARPSQFITVQEAVHPTKATVGGAGLFTVDTTGVAAHVRRSNLHAERRLELASRRGRTPDGMLHLGAALHVIEDLFAHSNWVEIALRKALADDPTLLHSVSGAAREVFTYTPTVTVGGKPRPVLITGTFTGSDTVISLHTELANLLSKPLPLPRTKDEVKAHRRFTEQLLRRFIQRYRTDSSFRKSLTKELTPTQLAVLDGTVPYLDRVYRWTGILPARLVAELEKITYALTAAIMTWARQTVAVHMQSRGIEVSVADTSLMASLDEQRRAMRGEFTGVKTATMTAAAMKEGTTLAKQRADAKKEAATRVAHLQKTPEHIVAGPSHSQLCKDHPNSPFYGLSFVLSVAAVERIGSRIRDAWIEQEPGQGARQHRFRSSEADLDKAFAKSANESLARATKVRTTGREIPAERFDLAKSRKVWANDVRDTAAAIIAVADAPTATATQLDKLSKLAGRGVARLSGSDAYAGEVVRDALTDLIPRLRKAASASRSAGTTLDQRVSLRQTAVALRRHAITIESAATHADREAANVKLQAYRRKVVDLLVRSPGIDHGFSAAVAVNIDLQVNATAPAYWAQQRSVIEGRTNIPGVQDQLTVASLPLPKLDGHPAKRRALLEEARRIVGHPYEDTWWVKPLTDFVKSNPAQVAAMITARNEGYAAFLPIDR